MTQDVIQWQFHQDVQTPDGPGIVWGRTTNNLIMVRMDEPKPGKLFYKGWIGFYPADRLSVLPENKGKKK